MGLIGRMLSIRTYLRALAPDTSFSDVPAWVIVLVTAAVVGAVSAVVAVIGLARWRNRSASLPAPVEIEVEEPPQ